MFLCARGDVLHALPVRSVYRLQPTRESVSHQPERNSTTRRLLLVTHASFRFSPVIGFGCNPTHSNPSTAFSTPLLWAVQQVSNLLEGQQHQCCQNISKQNAIRDSLRCLCLGHLSVDRGSVERNICNGPKTSGERSSLLENNFLFAFLFQFFFFCFLWCVSEGIHSMYVIRMELNLLYGNAFREQNQRAERITQYPFPPHLC